MYDSRFNFMSEMNKMLSDILLVARHKDLSVLFITQNSSNLEINVIRQADYLILKPSSLLQKDFERTKIKKIYEEVVDDFSELKDDRGLTYIYSDKFRGFISNPLPSFWSEKVSKGFAWLFESQIMVAIYQPDQIGIPKLVQVLKADIKQGQLSDFQKGNQKELFDKLEQTGFKPVITPPLIGLILDKLPEELKKGIIQVAVEYPGKALIDLTMILVPQTTKTTLDKFREQRMRK